MEPKKDKWINDILDSLDGMQRVDPGPFLFAKILNRLTAEQTPVYISVRAVWAIAASFALLLLLNWQIINPSASPNATQPADLDTIISEMQLYPANNQLYNNLWSEQNY